MPSGLENLDGGRFILRYEHPFGGVASNASQEDIGPGQLVICDGLFIRDGRLCSTNFYAFDPLYYKHTSTNALYWTNTTGVQAIYTLGSNFYAIDVICNTFVNSTGLVWTVDKNLSVPNPSHYSCSIMIDQIIYIFDYDAATQYVYVPGQNITQALQMDGSPQNFVAGKYCMTVDRYLIVCNINMPTDSPQKHANGYAWSGPSQYTTFNPAKTVDPSQTEGWNYLAEVQREITGCFAMGNVGYILHDQGITQLTPTGGANSGILPFDATLLWGGKDGNGCTYPDTLSVYGYIAIWANNTDIYMFMANSAPQSITGNARRAIYRDLNLFKPPAQSYYSISGNLINMGVDNISPELVYNLYIIYENASNATIMIVWSFVFATQAWTRVVVNLTATFQSITGNNNYNGFPGISTPGTGSKAVVPSGLRFGSPLTNVSTYIGGTYGGVVINTRASSSNDSFFLFQYINTDGLSTITDSPPTTNLQFRTEEFQIYRKPTIRGVILRASGGGTGPNNTGTLHINVGGQNFTDITVNSPNTTTLYRSYGVHTDMAPYINITSTNFNGLITKVHAFGTYAEGEPI